MTRTKKRLGEFVIRKGRELNDDTRHHVRRHYKFQDGRGGHEIRDRRIEEISRIVAKSKQIQGRRRIYMNKIPYQRISTDTTSSFSEGAYCKATKLIRLIRKSACRTVSGGEGREGRRGGGGVGKEGHKRRFHDADTSIFIRRFERNARFTVLSSTGIIRNAEHGRGNLWIPLPVDIYGRDVSSTSTYFSFFFPPSRRVLFIRRGGM